MEQDQGARAPEEPQSPNGEAFAPPDGGESVSARAVEPDSTAAGEGGVAESVAQEPAVSAAAVTGTTSGAHGGGRVMADRVSVEQGAIGTAEGLNVEVLQGAIGLARGEHVRVTQGAIGAAFATDVHLQMGGAQLVVAKESVRIEQGAAATVLTQRAELARGSFVGFLVALHVEGETRAMFDWRGALAFGAAFAVLSTILRGRRRRS